MKKIGLTNNDLVLMALFFTGLTLLFAGIFLKSFWVIGGVAGLVAAWFLCIDSVIANHKMPLLKLIVFGSIILFMPLFFAVYLSA